MTKTKSHRSRPLIHRVKINGRSHPIPSLGFRSGKISSLGHTNGSLHLEDGIDPTSFQWQKNARGDCWKLPKGSEKFPDSKKSSTGPTERTPKPEYLIALATYGQGSVGKVLFNF